LLLIKVEIFFLSSYIALSNWIWKIYHIDIILRPKLCQFVQFEISPSMSHKVFIFLKITHQWKIHIMPCKRLLTTFLSECWLTYSYFRNITDCWLTYSYFRNITDCWLTYSYFRNITDCWFTYSYFRNITDCWFTYSYIKI
jgi:hypothetical protein